MLQDTEESLVLVRKYCQISPKNANLNNLATDPGFGSGLEDSDPLTDRILRPKDPDPDSVRFGFVPSTNRSAIVESR
jgi:hypothetical protein